MKPAAMPWLALLLPAVAAAAEPADYTRDIRPILAKTCVGCHGAEKQRASLRLDSASGIREGGNAGPAIVPGKSAESLLIKAVSGAEGVAAMPPKGSRLAKAEIDLLRAWIDQGAKAPVGETTEAGRATSKHWAFQPIQRRAEPAVKQ